jgi:hypothetical protein
LAPISPISVDEEHEPPTLLDLKRQEEEVEREEELEIEQKREAAYQLALERGLKANASQSSEGRAGSNTIDDGQFLTMKVAASSNSSIQESEPFPDIASPSLDKHALENGKTSTSGGSGPTKDGGA